MEALYEPILIRLSPHPFGAHPDGWLYVAAAPLPGTARIDVDRLDLIFRQPCLHRFGDELPRYACPSGCLRQAIYAMLRFTPIVASRLGRCSVLLDSHAHPLQNIPALECPISTEHMALSGIFIKDSQHPNGSSPYCPITDEVLVSCYMASMLCLLWQATRYASSHHLLPSRRNSQPKGTSHFLDISFAHPVTFLPQQGSYTTIPIARMLIAQYHKCFDESMLPGGWLLGMIPIVRARNSKEVADFPATSQSSLNGFECIGARHIASILPGSEFFLTRSLPLVSPFRPPSALYLAPTRGSIRIRTPGLGF